MLQGAPSTQHIVKDGVQDASKATYPRQLASQGFKDFGVIPRLPPRPPLPPLALQPPLQRRQHHLRHQLRHHHHYLTNMMVYHIHVERVSVAIVGASTTTQRTMEKPGNFATVVQPKPVPILCETA